MDFQKIYAEFETARANGNLEKMSNIILQMSELYLKFFQAGREKELPYEVHKILSYTDTLIYQVMKFLSDGKGDKAKLYIMPIIRVLDFNKFFHLYYLLGRTFYLTGDYLHAMKFFMRYEKIRTSFWADNDEINLFYLANSLALMKDFRMSAQLYERILNIKANFPEVKKNLKLVQSGTNKNLVREVKSLWKFPSWRDVPIFINARDRLGVMKRLIDWLLDAGYRNLIILDNNSTYPPLLEYYNNLERIRGGACKNYSTKGKSRL